MDDAQYSALPEYARYDEGKAVGTCDGAFRPENRQPHGAMRPGKTYEDQLPVDQRSRVKAAQQRAEKARKS